MLFNDLSDDHKNQIESLNLEMSLVEECLEEFNLQEYPSFKPYGFILTFINSAGIKCIERRDMVTALGLTGAGDKYALESFK